MTNGRVKWFSESKGFGFITTADDQQVFVHHSSLQGGGFESLAEGDAVTFDIEKGPKGLTAVNVRLACLPGDSTTDAPPPVIKKKSDAR